MNLKNYQIKLESIGGLGANLIGKMLGEIGAIYYKLNAQSFAEYGSEKRGSPVKSYIRLSNKEIRVNTPITNPDLLALFNINLAGKENCMAGINEKSVVVVNTSLAHDAVRKQLKMYAGTLYTVDALNLAREYKTRANMVMLGAISKASGFIEFDAVKWVIEETIGKKYPDTLKNNIMGAEQGYNCVKEKYYDAESFPYNEYEQVKRNWGYDNAPIGGINTFFGSTATNDVSGSREGYIPLFHEDKCINCGLCDTTCPDLAFQFVKAHKGIKNLGIDYRHCKGCLRCVEVCPTNAITFDLEEKYNTSKLTVENIDLINTDFIYTDTGSNSWMESVSYTTNSEN